jgi:DNA invertase Pin-like site-specific DNA recombinase
VKLPRAFDDLAGLRAARWVRESTRGQYDTFGPDAQRDQQDRAIERYRLEDTGLSWTVAHSGRTVGNTQQFADMLAQAGVTYDVLVVGYVSRFARDLRTAVNARHDLHIAGAAVLFCDERVLSSDEDAWDTWARETVESESYSRRLGKRISEGYAAKFRRLGDQAGNAPWGMRRTGPTHTLEPDPSTIGDVVRAFEMWAVGNVTNGMIADEFGVGIERVRKALRNPIYNGWAVRRRGQDRTPAPWREHPPVDDVLWERAQRVRDVRSRGGQEPGKWKRGVDPLGGLLWCVCGKRIRTNGTAGSPPRRQRTHPDPVCEAWGGPRTQWGAFHDAPIAAQVTSLRLDDATLTKVVRAVTQEEVPMQPSIDGARIARRRREVALDHAAGKINDEEYIAAARELRKAPAPEPTTSIVTADTAIGYIRDLGRLGMPPTSRSEQTCSTRSTRESR